MQIQLSMSDEAILRKAGVATNSLWLLKGIKQEKSGASFGERAL
jgi:hypothetical protein